MRATKSGAKPRAKAAVSATTVVPRLPTPEAIDHVPWPYFAVSAAERRRMVARQQPQTVALVALGATTPVVATQAAPAMTVPQAIRRATAALRPPPSSSTSSVSVPPATRALPGTRRPAAQPAHPPRRAGPVPVTAPVPAVSAMSTGPVAGGPAVQAMKPRRVAGPLTPSPVIGGATPVPKTTASPASAARPIATMRLPPVPDAARLTSWAIALGLLGILCGFVTGVPAVVCGHLALRRLAHTRGSLALRRRAQWAIALGYATTLFWAAYVLLTMVRS
ncbi:MAG TPA: DUF4190 domain-containing protein [Ktedonobacterales bacterium]